MTFVEKRKAVYQMLVSKPYIYDGIPLEPENERSINPAYDKCPKCGGEMMTAYISSDREYWVNLCGREGSLLVCPYCGETGKFELLRMN